MAKRFHDTTIWKKQRWFKKLPRDYKLAFLYVKDQCDHAGLWKIDFAELVDDLDFDGFDMEDFIKNCNKDFDKINGKSITRERVKLLENKSIMWVTGFVQFQYEGKDLTINPQVPVVKSAIEILNSYKILGEALYKGYLTLPEHYSKATERTKDKDKDKDKDIYSIILEVSNTLRAEKQNTFSKIEPGQKGKSIFINGVEHKAAKNGSGYVYPTIRGTEFDKNFTKVKLMDDTWQELTKPQSNAAKNGNMMPQEIFKGKIK